VSPPDGAQDELDAVRKGLDSVADDFDRIASARRQRDAGRQVAATHALRRDIRFYERAERALKRAVEG
jgi:hypothetical protein